MQNLSYENEFCMQFHFHANQNHFHKNGFALRLPLKQRHKGTRKWPTLSRHIQWTKRKRDYSYSTWLAHLEELRPIFSSSSFVIRVSLLHP